VTAGDMLLIFEDRCVPATRRYVVYKSEKTVKDQSVNGHKSSNIAGKKRRSDDSLSLL
jgi:hypothetical protein